MSSRGVVVCLDTEGFHDDENDSPFVGEKFTDKDEADVVWELDMMKQLKVSQHNMCSCSITGVGDLLFVNTANGVDEGHFTIPEEEAPSFICVNRNSGKFCGATNRRVPTFFTASGRLQRTEFLTVLLRYCLPAVTVICIAFRQKAKTENPNCCGNSTAIPRIPCTRSRVPRETT